MNRQSIHQQIEALLKTVYEQHQALKSHPGSVSQIEFDFLLQNLRQLYEAALMLNHANALSSLDEVKAAVAQKILAEKRAAEMRITESKPVEVTSAANESAFTGLPPTETHTEETTAPEVVKVPMNEVIARAASVASEQIPLSRKEKSAYDLNSALYEEKNTLGKKFTTAESLHQKVAPQRTATVSDRLHSKPIKDLTTAIGINEKFLFVSRLFKGNLQHYSEAIDKINKENNLSAAKEFIQKELANKFSWEDSDENVRNFIELVERRFVQS